MKKQVVRDHYPGEDNIRIHNLSGIAFGNL